MHYRCWNRLSAPAVALIAIAWYATSGTAFSQSLSTSTAADANSKGAIAWFEKELIGSASLADLSKLADHAQTKQPISKSDAEHAIKLLTARYKDLLLEEHKKEHEAKQVVLGEHKLKYEYTVFGEKPADGHCLVISMHGGGGAPKRVNDRQWANQKRLYTLQEGIYLAPRAPTDTWNLWQASHIDPLFTRLIGDMIAFEGVDPNRIYITGYSAGGDGVYQLAFRMADQFAAAAMMAGHPNDAKPEGLRNLPFTLHVGANDSGYKRNIKAAQWKEMLKTLQQEDPKGYEHWAKLHPGKPHWMDRQDKEGVEWMLKFQRNREPDKVVWIQDNVLHNRFYWLAVPNPAMRQTLIVSRDSQNFAVEHSDMSEFSLLLRDSMLDMEQPVDVSYQGKLVHSGHAIRTLNTIIETMCDRGDPEAIFSSRIVVTLPEH